MKLRSAFTSAPAVAGLAILAVTIGAVAGMRSGVDDTPRTQVAGAVIERSEPAPPTETDGGDDRVEDPIIVVPAPPSPEAPPAPPQPEPVPVVGDPTEPEEPVGLVRDDAAPQPRQRGDRNRTQPEPEPTRSPRPSPSPTQDPAELALQPGSVDGTDHAIANDEGNWDIKRISGHGQNAQAQRSRAAHHRMTAKFSDNVVTSTKRVRAFRCDVVLDAGSRRLIVDDNNHEFAISLWTSDGYSAAKLVDTVMVRAELDMAPGVSRTVRGGTYELDARDGQSYTCRAEYRRL